MTLIYVLMFHVVETYKSSLTRNEKLKYNIDWLTEAIRRYSDAWAAGRDLLTVNMKSPMRQEKVGLSSDVPRLCT